MAETIETLPAALEAAARQYGSRIFLSEPNRTLSYDETLSRVARAAGALVDLGLAPNDVVALWAPNSFEWVIACLAAQWAGVTVVPLNTRLKGTEAAYILNRVRARVLLTVTQFAGNDYRALIAYEQLPSLETTLTLNEEWDGFEAQGHAIENRSRPETVADIIFTSGTTGTPKGVMSSQRQNVATSRAWATRVGISVDDKYLLVNPFFHTFGYKAGWMACLLVGAAGVPMGSFDVRQMADWIETERATVLTGAPTIFQTLLDDGEVREKCITLRTAVTGAASVPPVLIERMRDELQIPTVLTGYGLTESTGVVALTDATDSAEVAATTAGRPIPGVEVKCVDQDGAALPQGEAGEIWVRGFNVMQGYFEDGAATSEAIDRDGWLHTGDVGRFTLDGCLQITDRLKDMYISGGFNCYPAEIERLLATHPGIAASAVIGIADERMGEVGKAFIVARPGHSLAPDAVIAWAKSAMANYKVPRVVEVVPSLPINASGKVQKFALKSFASALDRHCQ